MRQNRLIFLLLMFMLSLGLYGQDRRIGVNLADVSNFSTQFIFVDVMKMSSAWLVQPEDASVFHIEGATVPDGPNGYPGHVPFEHEGQMVRPHVTLFSNMPEAFLYPAGEYTLLFEGTGTITLQWDVENEFFTTSESGMAHSVQVNPTTLGLNLIINASSANDPVRNIRLIMPGFEEVYEEAPYHPAFLSLMEPFEAMRFMKPLATEENPIGDWAERTAPENYTYVADEFTGAHFAMPYEHVAGIANAVDRDAWVNVPYLADDEYVRNMATIFSEQLEDGRQLYVEYANEAWNTLYPNTRAYMTEQGRMMGFGEDELEANMRFHAYRSFQVWEIFREAFGERSDQVVALMGSWSFVDAGRYTIDAIKDPMVNPEGTLPDAIGIAAYMGIEVIDGLIDDFGTCGFDENDIMDALDATMEPEMDEYMERFQFWSDSTGIDIFAYEGGQHVSAGNFGLNEECVAEVIARANNSERMAGLYCRFFDLWYDKWDGGLFMSFVLAEGYGIGGAFGILESTLQNPMTSEKWGAHETCIFQGNSAAPEMLLGGTPGFSMPIEVGSTATTSFTITNNGTADLEVTSINFPEGFSSDWTSGTVTAQSAQEVTVTFSPTEPRTYGGDIVVNSNAGMQQISISATGSAVASLDNRIDVSGLIRTFPNPAHDYIDIDLSAVNEQQLQLAIYDMAGNRKISTLTNYNNQVRVDLTGVSSGIYFLHLTGTRHRARIRLLVN